MFKAFKIHVENAVKFLESKSTLFTTEVSKEELWDTYINAFPEGTDPIYISETVHSCNCCKSFLRRYGNVVGIIDNKVISLWDNYENLPHPYNVVAEKLNALVATKSINGVFLTEETSMGTDYNLGIDPSSEKYEKRFEHFSAQTPVSCISNDVATKKGEFLQTYAVIKRSMDEFSKESIDSVMDLINEGTLPRAEQFRFAIETFQRFQSEWEGTEEELWIATAKYGRKLAIRNTAIGTLLIEINEGIPLLDAVTKFGRTIVGVSYKRPKAIFTRKQVLEAENKLKALGFEDSIPVRHATLGDLNIQHVFWTSSKAKSLMSGALDGLLEDLVEKKPAYGTEMDIQAFMKILPTIKDLEILVENNHEGNFMNMLAQERGPSILAWDNGFRWSYNGENTISSITKSVKNRGGNVDGLLRFSISWADNAEDNSDLDAHCTYLDKHIYYSRKRTEHGHLDVDIQTPKSYKSDIVENIVFTELVDAKFKFRVHNYALRGVQKGFKAEVVFGGTTHSFVYNKGLRQGEFVNVATVTCKNGKMSMKSHIPSEAQSRNIWGINTQKYHKVDTFMLSPNYWKDKVGNPHYFFIIDGVKNPSSVRGIYNEFLNPVLQQEKRVFEALGARTRASYSDNQLAGLGFSVNTKDSITVRADGKVIKLKFNGHFQTSPNTKVKVSNR